MQASRYESVASVESVESVSAQEQRSDPSSSSSPPALDPVGGGHPLKNAEALGIFTLLMMSYLRLLRAVRHIFSIMHVPDILETIFPNWKVAAIQAISIESTETEWVFSTTPPVPRGVIR